MPTFPSGIDQQLEAVRRRDPLIGMFERGMSAVSRELMEPLGPYNPELPAAAMLKGASLLAPLLAGVAKWGDEAAEAPKIAKNMEDAWVKAMEIGDKLSKGYAYQSKLPEGDAFQLSAKALEAAGPKLAEGSLDLGELTEIMKRAISEEGSSLAKMRGIDIGSTAAASGDIVSGEAALENLAQEAAVRAEQALGGAEAAEPGSGLLTSGQFEALGSTADPLKKIIGRRDWRQARKKIVQGLGQTGQVKLYEDPFTVQRRVSEWAKSQKAAKGIIEAFGKAPDLRPSTILNEAMTQKKFTRQSVDEAIKKAFDESKFVTPGSNKPVSSLPPKIQERFIKNHPVYRYIVGGGNLAKLAAGNDLNLDILTRQAEHIRKLTWKNLGLPEPDLSKMKF